MLEAQHEQQGMLTVLFEKEQRGVRTALMSIRNENQDIIHTSFNAQMAGELGLEIILVRGPSPRIKSLEQQLTAKRGIRSVRLNLIPL
jgi:metal-responsive CopG/Arc/MetJ family transcriptional regulator